MTARWGIVGGGRIAERFLDAVRRDVGHPDGGGRVVAVASRSRARGRAWADAHDIERAHEGLDELAADDGVDAWYVASPHHAHVDQVVAAAEAGVAVLVEKPFGVTAAGVARAIAACRRAEVPLLEAMWSRFLPIHEVVRGWIDDGRIGEVLHVRAGLGFVAPRDVQDRLLNPELAGGATLDLGCYPLAFAQSILGDPTQLLAVGHVGPTGVDEEVQVVTRYADGTGATLDGSLRAAMDRSAVVSGTAGRIVLCPPMNGPTRAELHTLRPGWPHDGPPDEVVERPFDIDGFEYQVREVHRMLAEGRTEAPLMPWAHSLALAGQMDDIRRQLGVTLPMDDADPPV